ncbi:MAG: helix-turn-helix domain-containing protein [Coriobacteriales bacterium]
MTRDYTYVSLISSDTDEELTPELMAQELSRRFACSVVARCKELDITLLELARRCSISPSTLSEKLNGRNLTLKSMAAIAVALGSDVLGPELILSNQDAPAEVGEDSSAQPEAREPLPPLEITEESEELCC